VYFITVYQSSQHLLLQISQFQINFYICFYKLVNFILKKFKHSYFNSNLFTFSATFLHNFDREPCSIASQLFRIVLEPIFEIDVLLSDHFSFLSVILCNISKITAWCADEEGMEWRS